MFKEIINLAPFGHARTSQIKKLLLEKVNGENAIYSVYTEWPGYPDLDNYMLITTDPDTRDIVAIDFDGGPYLTFGTQIKGATVVGFMYEGEYNNIKVILLDDGNTNTVSN